MMLVARHINGSIVYMFVNGYDIGIYRIKDIPFSAFREATEEEIERHYAWYSMYQ